MQECLVPQLWTAETTSVDPRVHTCGPDGPQLWNETNVSKERHTFTQEKI